MSYLRKTALALTVCLGLGLSFLGVASLGQAAPPQAAGPSVILKEIDETQTPLEKEGVSPELGGWRLTADKARRFRLFEHPVKGLEQGVITFSARLRASGIKGMAFLEMWCRFPGKGEFFSRGLDQAIKGDRDDWFEARIPFYLKQGQIPDLVKMGVVLTGKGTVWIKDIKLSFTPQQ